MAVSNASSFRPGNDSFTVAMNFKLGGFLERSGMPDLEFAPLLTWQDEDFSDGAAFRVQSTDETGDTLSVFLDDGTSRQELAIDTGASLLDEWHHAAYTVDRTTSEVTLYLNGEKIGSVALSVGSIDPTRDLLIGQYDFITARGGNPRFVGGENLLIDDVKVFGNSLNASEIRSLVAVPEPSTFALLGISAMGFYYVRRRRKNGSESNTARANLEKD